MAVVFGAWETSIRTRWISAPVCDGSAACVKCGASIVKNEHAFKHKGDLGTYCHGCSLAAHATPG